MCYSEVSKKTLNRDSECRLGIVAKRCIRNRGVLSSNPTHITEKQHWRARKATRNPLIKSTCLKKFLNN